MEKGNIGSPSGVRRRNRQAPVYPNSLPGSRSSSPGRNVMMKRAMFEENSSSNLLNSPSPKSKSATNKPPQNDTDIINIEGVEEFESVYNSTIKQSQKSYISSTSFAVSNPSGNANKQKLSNRNNTSVVSSSSKENKLSPNPETGDRGASKYIIPDYVSAVSVQSVDTYKRKVERPARLREDGARSRRHQTLQGRINHAPDDALAMRTKKYLPTYIQPVFTERKSKGNFGNESNVFTQKRDASQSNRVHAYEQTGKNQVKLHTSRLSRQRFASSEDSNSSEMSTNQDSMKKSSETVETQRTEREKEKPTSRSARRQIRRNTQEQNKTTSPSIEQSAKEICGNKVTIDGQNNLSDQQSVGVGVESLKQSDNSKVGASRDKPTAGRRVRHRNRHRQQPQIHVAETEDKYSTLPADFKPAENTSFLISGGPNSAQNTLLSNNRTQSHLASRNELMIRDEQTSAVSENVGKKGTDAIRDIANHPVHKQSLLTNQSIDKTDSNTNRRGSAERRSNLSSTFQAKLKEAESRSKFVSDNQVKFEFGVAYNKNRPKQDSAVQSQRIKQTATKEPENVAYSQPMLKATKISEDYWPRDEATEKLLNRNHSSNALSSAAEQSNSMSESVNYTSSEQSAISRSAFVNLDILSSKETNLNDPVETTVFDDFSRSPGFSQEPNPSSQSVVIRSPVENNASSDSGVKNKESQNLVLGQKALSEWSYDDPDSKLNDFYKDLSEIETNTGKNNPLPESDKPRFKTSNSDLNLPTLRDITLKGKPLFVAEYPSSRTNASASSKQFGKETSNTRTSEAETTGNKTSRSSNSSVHSSSNMVGDISTSERKNSVVSESTALPKNGNSLNVRNSTESDEGYGGPDPNIVEENYAMFNKTPRKPRSDLIGNRRRRKASSANGQSGSDCSNNGENTNRSLSDPTHDRKKSPNLEEDETRAIDSNYEVALNSKALDDQDIPCSISECSDATSIQSSCLNESHLGINEDNSSLIDSSSTVSKKKKSFSDPDSNAVITARLLNQNNLRLNINSTSNSSSDSNLPETIESRSTFQPERTIKDVVNSSGWISTGSSRSDIGDHPQPIDKNVYSHEFEKEVQSKYNRRKNPKSRKFYKPVVLDSSFRDVTKSEGHFEPIRNVENENPVEEEEGAFKLVFESMKKSDTLSVPQPIHERSASEPVSTENSIAYRKISERGRRAGIVQAPSLNDVLKSENALPSTESSESQSEDMLDRSTPILPLNASIGHSVNANKRTDNQALRKHVVNNMLAAENSYVESLGTLVKSYLEPLKRPEGINICDPNLVDEIFFQIPQMFLHHKKFYAAVKKFYTNWDPDCKIGELFLEYFSDADLSETYTSFTNNYMDAKLAIKKACEAKGSFRTFLEHCQRENKNKQSLDDILIQPIQRLPRYELIIKDLLNYTSYHHPDHEGLLAAQKMFHSLVVQMDEEKKALETAEKNLRYLREIQHNIDDCVEISDTFKRTFIQQFFCHEGLPQKAGNKKDGRCLWLFSDILLCTNVKKTRNTATRRSSISLSSVPHEYPPFDSTCKYKFQWKFDLESIELRGDDHFLVSSKDQIKQLQKDQEKLNRIKELASKLHTHHMELEEVIVHVQESTVKAISEKQQQFQQIEQLYQHSNSSPGRLDLIILPGTHSSKLVQFEFIETVKPEFERLFWETRSKLTEDSKPPTEVDAPPRNEPQFLKPIPISKTRNGMQFSCAAPCIDSSVGQKEVWVCNTDGYAGQVCFLSLESEPKQTQCLTVCNAKIHCIELVPSWDTKLVPTRSMIDAIAKAPLAQTGGRRTSSIDPVSYSIIAFDEDSESDEDNTSPYSTKTTSPYNTFNNSMSPHNTNHIVDSLSPPDNSPAFDWKLDSDNPETDSQITDSGCNIRFSQRSSIMSGTSVHGGGAYKKDSDGVTRYGSLGDLLNDGNSDLITGSETVSNQSSMWLGTDDGKVNIYLTSDALRGGNCHLQLHHSSSVQCILSHLDQVFIALSNGELIVYCRDHDNGGQWNFTQRKSIGGTTSNNPITKMLIVNENELWCGCQNQVRIYDIKTHEPKSSFLVCSDAKRQILCMSSFEYGVWIALDKRSQIKLFHSISHEPLTEVDVSDAVSKMLSNCDAIIRQHKAACLRVTTLLVCKKLLWMGTSAGVVLTLNLPSISESTTHIPIPFGLQPKGVSYGHTGHVRFLTSVKVADKEPQERGRRMSTVRRSSSSGSHQSRGSTLVISGGDGYEDFQMNSISDAGREDSTNHLLIWKV